MGAEKVFLFALTAAEVLALNPDFFTSSGAAARLLVGERPAVSNFGVCRQGVQALIDRPIPKPRSKRHAADPVLDKTLAVAWKSPSARKAKVKRDHSEPRLAKLAPPLPRFFLNAI